MKRSSQVGLVIMAAAGVGAISYAMMPRGECQRINAQGEPEPCRSGIGSSRIGTRSGWSFFSGESNTHATSTSTSVASAAGATERSGFGAYARAVGAHFSSGS